MSKGIVLYSYWRSSCSWRVRLALALKGLEFETKAVNLLKGEQRSDEYLEINPAGTVPTIRFADGLCLSDSMAICALLDRRFPDKSPLVPADDETAASVWRIALLIHSGIQPIQNFKVLTWVDKELQADKVAWAHHFISEGFTALEKILAKTAGQCCVGDALSLADICLVPQVYNARRFDVDMSRFPTITRVEAHLSGLESFQAAHPSRQVDAPEDQRK